MFHFKSLALTDSGNDSTLRSGWESRLTKSLKDGDEMINDPGKHEVKNGDRTVAYCDET